jgi:prepilin-type N-terminal cleavage/methylation domain-containing protein
MLKTMQPALSTRFRQRAFTLIELALVLVILGLLMGGIVGGQALLKAAALGKTIRFQTNMKSTVTAFRDKYMAIPGDMPNATSFWDRSNLVVMNCAADPGTAAATGTCNGGGDGYITYATAMPAESALFIHHLSLAGMDSTALAAGYSFPTAPTSYYQTPGMTQAYSYAGGSGPYADPYFSPLSSSSMARGIALHTAGMCSGAPKAAVITAEDAYAIDRKIDDGKPTKGLFIAMDGSTDTDCSAYQECINPLDTSSYSVTGIDKACRFMFLLIPR